MISISSNLNLMIKAAEKASKSAIRDFGEVEKLQVSKKGPYDFITKTDKNIEKILDDQKVGEKIREGFKIAILGPTNVGKSSLLNHLSNRDVAIVSEIAGTTRDVIEKKVNLNGAPVIFFDTAGIRETRNIVEREGIKKAKKTLTIIHIIFACSHSTRVMGYKKINKKCPYLPC